MKLKDERQVKLECWHWTEPMTQEELIAAYASGEAKCPVCKSAKSVTNIYRSGGKRFDASERPIDTPPPEPLKVWARHDGLMVRHRPPSDERAWWCRFCDGKYGKARNGAVRRADDLPSMYAEWDDHVRTQRHTEVIRFRTQVDAIASVFDRSPSGE